MLELLSSVRRSFSSSANYSVNMELKKELLEWYNSQLEEKNIFLSSL
jgi:hypothetical protein